MKRLLYLVIPLIVGVVGFIIFQVLVLQNNGKGALQVTAHPKSAVYLNGKLIGQTPLCKCDSAEMLPSGEYTIRLVPLGQQAANTLDPFEAKLKIQKSILSVVDRSFGPGATSEGSILTLSPILDKKAIEVLFLSFPDNSEVMTDSNSSGYSPLLVKSLTNSDHDILFKKDGYKEKTIRIHPEPGYKLEALVFLGVNPVEETVSPVATLSATVTPTPSPAPLKVTILQTPTGYLNVRADASIQSTKIDTVYPGNTYALIEGKDGWYNITIENGKTGWISADYAKKE